MDRPTSCHISPAAAILQIMGLAGANHVLTALVALLPDFAESGIHDQLEMFGHAASSDLTQALLLYAVIPGFAEELLFRGVLFWAIDRFAGPRWAIAVTSIAFGLAHPDLHHGIIATVLGLQLGFIRVVGGFWLAVAAHVANNALVLGWRFLAEARPGILAPFEGLENPGLLVAFAIAGIACASLAQRWVALGRPSKTDGTALQTATGLDE